MMKRFVLLFCIAAALLPLSAQRLAKSAISLEDIWTRYSFFPESPESFRWMKDDNHYATLEEGKLTQFHILDESKSRVLLDLAALPLQGIKAADVSDYAFSPDEKRILLIANRKPVYRRSSLEWCGVYTPATRSLQVLQDGQPISNASFSPDGSKIAYTFQNDLYLSDLESGESLRVSSDGKHNEIINGSTDWVYEEEFSFVRAFEWSPDGQYLAYLRFDERAVKEFRLERYQGNYPQLYSFKYPKAGEDNAIVSAHIFNLKSGKTIQVDTGTESDQYLLRLNWSPVGKLGLIRLNRLQNRAELLLADPQSGESNLLLVESADTYVDIEMLYWKFTGEQGDFYWSSERDGYHHLYRYNADATKVQQVTRGPWEISEIAGIYEAKGLIYFISPEVSPSERHLYSIRTDGTDKRRLSPEAGKHSVEFSSGLRYYVDTYSTLTSPPLSRLRSADGKVLKVLVDNEALRAYTSTLRLSAPEFFSFDNSEGVKLNGFMIKPPDFKRNKRYPVLMYCYGGPGSQTVENEWNPGDYFWFQMLAQRGYIVVSVDGRGTGARGAEFRKATYANMGHLECTDQIETARWLQRQSYVDPARIGIWGWSFGGYLSALSLLKGADIFKCGIAVAPVTNWRLYDTIYTERYLKKPQDNAKGYDENSPIQFAQNLKAPLLLVHGAADDNVHLQNTLMFADALVRANKQFEMQIYPNRNHGIYGGNTRFHLYTRMTNFLLENL